MPGWSAHCIRPGAKSFLFWLAAVAVLTRAGANEPAITSQPQSATNAAGVTVTFAAAASGSFPLSFRWLRNGMALNDAGRISGAGSEVLQVALVRPQDAGDYQLVVTNVSGSVTSAVATLTVIPPATVTIPDVGLEAGLRSWLGKPTAPLTPADMAGLTVFCASSLGISNLSGLEWATNLTGLALAHNAISDLTPLDTLTALVQLDVSHNAVTNLAPLAQHLALTNLNLGQNQITSVAPLSALTNLAQLWLHQNPLGSLAPLSGLVQLDSLVVFQTDVSDVAPLAPLRKLEHLELRANALANAATVLPQLTNLHTLFLGRTGLTNLAFASTMTQLQYLNLDNNQIADVALLADLPALRQLDLSCNPLTNLTSLSVLTHLETLHLAGNSVSNLAALTNLAQLKSLCLEDNALSDLTLLTNHAPLTHLGLSRNPATDLAPLAALTNLTTLQLDGLPITNATFLEALPALAAVSLRSTRLASLAPMAGLTNLVAVFAHDNWLTDIGVLAGLPKLARVELTGNLLDVSSNSAPLEVVASLHSRGAQVDWLPQNQPPTIAMPAAWVIATNRTSSLTLHIADDLTPAGQLLVAAHATNPGLLPGVGLEPGPLPDQLKLTVTPAPDQTGTATVNVAVTDGAGLMTNVALMVTVVAPTPVAIPDPSLTEAIGWELGTASTAFDTLDLATLTRLSVFNGAVTNLNGLEWATNLVELSLLGMNLTQITPLAGLPRLESLTLISPSLLDCSPLAGLTNLTYLHLEAISATNMQWLVNLRQLTHLTLLVPQAEDLSLVSTLTNLFTLQLSARLHNNLGFLAPLNQLVALSLADCHISDLSTLAAPAALQVLELQRNQLTNLAPLTNWYSLDYLDVRYNQLYTTDHPPLQVLRGRVTTVLDQPQRTAPELVHPEFWIGAAGAPTYIRFKVMDEGAAAWEQPTVFVQSSNPMLAPGTNLFWQRDGDRALPDDWILTVIPPAGQASSNTLTLLVTSQSSLATTGALQLSVVLPAVLNPDVLDGTKLAWQTSGDAPWFGQSLITHDGLAAAQSGAITNYAQSWIQTVATGPGVLTFWWKVSSEPNYDWLEFRLNGVLQHRISGEDGWQYIQLALPPGDQTARWTYHKDNNASRGLDAAWLDQVQVKIPALINLTGLSATYDGSPKTVTAESSPPGLTVNVTYNGNPAPPGAAGSHEVEAMVDDPVYGGMTSNRLVITKAPLTVSVPHISRPAGQTNPPFVLAYNGFVNGENLNALATLPMASTPASPSSPPGTYPIHLLGGLADNYVLNLVPGILTITDTNTFIILSLTGAGTTNALITWRSVSSQTYRVEYRSSLDGAWTALPPDVIATNTTAAVYDRSGGAGARFYRVAQLTEILVAAPRILTVSQVDTTNILLTWSAESNRTYQLQYAASPGGPWFSLPPNITATNTTASAVDASGIQASCFYRIMAVP